MRAEKSNLTFNPSTIKDSASYKPTNISDLLKKNRNEEKREKMMKVYSIIIFAVVFFVSGFLILK
jgi:hypothetical protein